MVKFNHTAYIANTSLGWAFKLALLVLGLSVIAPPDSLARIGIGFIKANPVILALAIVLMCWTCVVLAELRARTLKVIVTSELIEFHVGRLVKKTQWIALADVRNIKFHANIVEQKLNAGTLHFETVGTGGVDMVLPQLDAADAERLRRQVAPATPESEAAV